MFIYIDGQPLEKVSYEKLIIVEGKVDGAIEDEKDRRVEEFLQQKY